MHVYDFPTLSETSQTETRLPPRSYHLDGVPAFRPVFLPVWFQFVSGRLEEDKG